ncbi:HdeA/HdeB family chaperone [Sphingomonas sp. 3-13AW]|jgi:hypothetical protein|uniref:HdeA/HdeB family chaperone n=1 Tax=Sphingomonas sp. 3-13AW TaxID=3050450 RepID=UPI003BB66502
MLRSFVIVGALFAASTAVASPGQQKPQVYEKAQVNQQNGMTDVTVFKVNKRFETVTCRDFNLVDVNYRPQAVVYAANYGPKGKPHPTVTVDGVADVVPLVVNACRARPGDNFIAAVQRARAQQRAGLKRSGK